MKAITILILLICFSIQGQSQPQLLKQSTRGNYSPSVYAKKTAVTYGLHPRIVDELLSIFKQDGMAVLEQEKRIEELLKAYQILPEAEKADRELSAHALEQLGIKQDSILSDVMQWAVFTEGDYSPAVFALGDVDIWYGISPDAFKGLYKVFMEKQGELLIKEGKLNEFEQLLATQIEKYEQLRKELAFREDEMAKEAQLLLDQGKIEEAIQVLRERYFFEKAQDKREKLETAKAAYDYAQALELDLKYREATAIYRDAVELDPDNSEYSLILANNLYQLGFYDEAISFFQTSIIADSIKLGGVLHEK